jgi:NADH-quinone oxidoreductase subunit J
MCVTRHVIAKLVSAIIALAFLKSYISSVWQIQYGEVNYLNLPSIADLIFTDFMLAFEVLSILLLAALIGAVYLAKKEAAE